MYKYTFKNNEDITINTPFCTDFSQIKQIPLIHTDSLIKRKSIYPNGFEIIFTQTAIETTIETNKPLIKRSNNSYDVQL